MMLSHWLMYILSQRCVIEVYTHCNKYAAFTHDHSDKDFDKISPCHKRQIVRATVPPACRSDFSPLECVSVLNEGGSSLARFKNGKK